MAEGVQGVRKRGGPRTLYNQNRPRIRDRQGRGVEKVVRPWAKVPPKRVRTWASRAECSLLGVFKRNKSKPL